MTRSGDELESKLLPLPRPRLEPEAEKPSPGRAEELYVRGQGRLGSKDYIGAVEAFTSALAMDPEHRGAYLGRALASHYLRDYPAAIRDNTKGLALRDSAVPYFNRALARQGDGDEEGARADLKKAPGVVLVEARERYEAKQYEKVIYYLDIVLEGDPRNFAALALRGEVSHLLSRFAEAVRDYTSALALECSPNILYSRGNARRSLGDLAGALADFDAAIELRTTDPDFYWRRGLVKEALGDAPGAFADFTRVHPTPSEQKKREIRAEIREKRRWRLAGLAASTVGWAVLLVFLPHLEAKNFWYFLFGAGVVWYSFNSLLDEESQALGRGEWHADPGFLIITGLALLGPLAWAVAVFRLTKAGAVCRTCRTEAAGGVSVCRRCATPLTADG